MRISVAGRRCLFLCTLISLSGVAIAQNPPANHVIIPNPTPRQPDLKQVYDDSAKDQAKQDEITIQNQLRAREIWLESNQILLLAQQLRQVVLSPKKSASMAANAAKAGQIEKLAKSVQQKMKAK